MAEPQNCIFCEVVGGSLPGYKVFEDDFVIVLMDIRPVYRGHALVVTKEHFENISDVPEDILAHAHKIAKKVALAEIKTFSPAGININQNNGSIAGQEIFHFHIHIIPKDSGRHERYVASKEELEMAAQQLKANMEM